MRHIDIPEDFHLIRMNNGIAMIRPEERKYIPVQYNLNHTVKSILQLTCNIYFSNVAHKYQLLNDFCAESCGFNSAKEALNKTMLDTATPESANLLFDNNNQVINCHKMKIIEEELILKKEDDFIQQGLSIKLPWYNNKFEILGLFGITVIFGKQNLDAIFSHMAEIGLLNQDKYFNNFNLNKFYFSKREKEIIHLMMTKRSSKEIGNQLGISPRTIEKHIEHIKNKLNVKSKADIITMMMAQ